MDLGPHDDNICVNGLRRGPPIIDLTALHTPQGRPRLVEQIGRACQYWGIFQVINHGIDPLAIRRMRAAGEAFFQQPLDEKLRLYDRNFYAPIRYTTSSIDSSVGESRDTLSFQRYPGECDGFQEAPDICKSPLLEYLAGIEELASSLYQAMFESLGLDEEYLGGVLPELAWIFMTLHFYPQCPDPSAALGMKEHSDVPSLAILEQGEVAGLEIKVGDGSWETVVPMRDAFVITVGDQIETLTNSKFKAIRHRVIINSNSARMSMIGFFGPLKDTLVSPLSKLVEQDNPYKGTKFWDYIKTRIPDGLIGSDLG